jgi:hypothetical protein
MESPLNGTWELDFKGSESPDEVMGLMGTFPLNKWRSICDSFE